MTEDTQRDSQLDRAINRRTVLKATGASAALGIGTGTVGAQSGNDGRGNGGGTGTGDGSSNPNYIDSIFGKAVAEGNPCAGDASEDCFEEFRPPIRPDHEIEMRIDIAGLLFGLAEAEVLSADQIGTLNGVVADGEITEPEGKMILLSVSLSMENRYPRMPSQVPWSTRSDSITTRRVSM